MAIEMLTEETMQQLLPLSPNDRKGFVQNFAITAWEKNNHRGTIEAATGIGKTKIGVIAIADQFKRDFDSLVYVVVPTKTLRDVDWPDEFRKWGYEDILPKVNFVLYTSLHKLKPPKDVDLMVMDEIHHYTLNSSFFHQTEKVYHILGLTALLPKAEKSEETGIKVALINSVAPTCFKVSLEDAIKLELVADFEVKVIKFKLDAKTKNIKAGSVTKPFMSTELEYYKYLTKMIQKMVIQKKEGAKFAYLGKRTQFINNLPTKRRVAAEAMQGLLKNGKRTLIFCGSIEQAEALCPGQTYHSKTDDSKLIAFQNKEINYLGVVKSMNEGKNIDDLEQILIVQLNSNELDVTQRIGRTIRFRPGHKGLVGVLVAEDTSDEKWYESAFGGFNQSRIKTYTL